ncbi:alpha-(1-2)-phosphatidylinositol mannoside mannosyltransferase [Actinomadura rubteroloni]|uniref:Alpha-(1-2)-phosphatidylinositol mannoside mannosyltransferase n=1 Tax=Actinomadura rubteroloni TaxID=1926885 RepID=A0A2P4UMA0_9ACTN|nr:glycosyltransferase 87 family protein [Actinomadura rubteroloni]POM26174.1 alpha-(1-2)-phosphatidylinositol mannoside mannosyltransferase [Actinomadura rubteroloni]
MRAGSRTPPWIVGLGVLVAVAAVAPIVVKWLNNPPDQRMVDLEVYREGGAAILRGAPLYDVLTQPPQLLPFTYPPFAAVLAVPFTLLPWKAAQWTWTALMYAALTVAVLYAFRDLIRRAGRWAPVAAGALVGATAWLWPASDQMRFGQVGFLLMALCLADCCARSARWPRGVLVGLAMAIKLVPGVFLIWFWITGRRDAAGTALLTALAAWGGAFALLPADSRDYWFGAFLQGGDRTGAVGGTTNQALNGMLAHVLPESPWRSLLWLVLAVAVALLGLRLARRATVAGDALGRPGPFGGTDLTRAAAAGPSAYTLLLAGAAITGLLSVLLSPVGWMHHLVWIIAVLGALAGDGRDPRRCVLALGVWLYFLFPLPWRGAALSGREHPMAVRIVGRILQDAFGLAALALIVVLGVWLVNRVRTSGDHGERTHGDARVGTLTP